MGKSQSKRVLESSGGMEGVRYSDGSPTGSSGANSLASRRRTKSLAWFWPSRGSERRVTANEPSFDGGEGGAWERGRFI